MQSTTSAYTDILVDHHTESNEFAFANEFLRKVNIAGYNQSYVEVTSISSTAQEERAGTLLANVAVMALIVKKRSRGRNKVRSL